jgi:formylglycine-generating enzyme required for sulfatase activity
MDSAPKPDAATETWNFIRDSRDPDDFERFAKAFPDSPYARGAEIRAAQLRKAGAPPISEVPHGKTKVNPKDGLTYVWIEPGTFMMGCSPGDGECRPDEKPAHQVTITRGFWMGQTDVTQEAYQRVTGKTPSYFKGAKLPVEKVTWTDSQNYCAATGMRLPTEAEWEYAARAGSTASRYGDIDSIAWYGNNSGNTTHPVMQKLANDWGLYDMLGNVWQWTADWYTDKYSGNNEADPKGPSSGQSRVVRGGSCGFLPGLVRVSLRGSNGPGRGGGVGVRCAGN